eukprot:10640501-Lingulodinium_polyedra.AAC.1
MRPQRARVRQHTRREHYIVLSPWRRADWKQPPYRWLVRLVAAYKEANPKRRVAIVGFSKGVWRARLWINLPLRM